MKSLSAPFASTALRVLSEQENFWKDLTPADLRDLLLYSLFMGFFPFAGYLFSYTIRGTIWNYWPFIQTTLDVGSALVFAGLQWILFATFPVLSALILDLTTSRFKTRVEFYNCVLLVAYALTPLCLSALFVGIPYVDRVTSTLGFATFLYLLYYGFRYLFGFTILRSAFATVILFVLFALIRELFVFAIGV